MSNESGVVVNGDFCLFRSLYLPNLHIQGHNYYIVLCSLLGGAENVGVENAGVENSAPSSRGGKRGTRWQGWKTWEWKTWHQVARVENAGVDNFRGVFGAESLLNAANSATELTSLKYIEHTNFHALRRTKKKFNEAVRLTNQRGSFAFSCRPSPFRLLRMSVIFCLHPPQIF